QSAFGILFPWVFVVPIVLVEAARLLRRRGADRNAVFSDAVFLLIMSFVTMFVVIALSQQQRFRYYLPLVAPVALLSGWWAESVVRGRVALKIPWRVCAAGGVLLVAAGIAGAFSRRNARNLREVVRADSQAVAIVADRALTSLEDRDGFTVLMHDRLALRPIVVVGYRTTSPTRPGIRGVTP